MIIMNSILRQLHFLSLQNSIIILGIILAAMAVTRLCGNKNLVTKRQIVAIRLVTIYGMILLCATVLCRYEGIRRFRPELFWSWKAVFEKNRTDLIYENLLNIFIFIPIGVLLSECFKIKKNKVFFLVMLIGITLSGLIEMSQFVMKCGLCEFDDIIHNTIGCAIGCFLRNRICNIFAKNEFIKNRMEEN